MATSNLSNYNFIIKPNSPSISPRYNSVIRPFACHGGMERII